MGTVIILIGVILLTTFGVYLARKTAVGLKDEQSSSYGIIKNEECHSLKYYVASPEGKTEGPFHPETLEVLARRKSITFETLICREGGNEWIKYGEFLSSATHEKSNSSKMNICAESERTRRNNYSASGVSEAFRWVGIVCFVLAIIIPLILLSSGSDQSIFAASIFLVLALSGRGWIGVAHIISLLEQIAKNTGK